MKKTLALFAVMFSLTILLALIWAAPTPAGTTNASEPTGGCQIDDLGYRNCDYAYYQAGALPFSDSGDTDGYDDDYDFGETPSECAASGTPSSLVGQGEDVVYRVATDVTCTLGVIMTPASTVDLVLYVLNPNCDDVNGNCVNWDDRGGPGGTEQLEFQASGGQDYYIIVDGYSYDEGEFDFEIHENGSTGCDLVNLLSSVGDTVWEDLDADGIQEAGENTLISGLTVDLRKCSDDSLVDSTAADPTAPSYIFVDLESDQYYLQFGLPQGYSFSPKDQGGNDHEDSDVDPATGKTDCFDLDSGLDDMSWDAGMFKVEEVYWLGDQVWYDTDQDGFQDEPMPGIHGGITATLYGSGDCTGPQVGVDDIDINGNYVFGGLDAGTYCLQFTGITDTWFISPKDQFGDDTQDSDANAQGQIQNIVLNANTLHQDMGIYAEGSVGGRVFCDADGDKAYDQGEGRSGATVRLYEDYTCNGQVDLQLAVKDTGQDGLYVFDELAVGPPGGKEVCYIVGVDRNTMGSCDVNWAPLDNAVKLEANNPDDLDNVFGLRERPILGDLVWWDSDCDGIQDGGEPGVSGIFVNLKETPDCSGDSLFSDTTDDAGHYDFPGLLPGWTYCIEFLDIPDDWKIGPANQGSDDTLDSDVDPDTGQILSITVPITGDLTQDLSLCPLKFRVYLPVVLR